MNFLLAGFLAIFISGCSMTKHSGELSDHYDGVRFHNQDPAVGGRKSLYEVIKWKCSHKEKSEQVELFQKEVIPEFPSTLDSDEVVVTFINHATVLIQFKGLTIITDPVFSDYVGPLSFLGYSRYQKVGVNLSELPKIDVVLISHNHYDHLDIPSIRMILETNDPLFIVPLKNGSFLKKMGARKIVELDWWQSYHLNETQQVLLTPAQHWSGRGLFDDCKSLWAGFVIMKDELKVFFAGDTGYASHFKEIFDRVGKIDVSLLPIGCYEPRWFMREQHMNPEEAVSAHLDLHSSCSMGIHFGTFKLADESLTQPVLALCQALKNKGVLPSQFITPVNGQTMRYTPKKSS